MSGNADIEQRWTDAWSDLYELTGGVYGVQCLLPDGQIVGPEDCKGWLQESVYAGWSVRVERGWVRGQPGVVIRIPVNQLCNNC